MGYRWELLNNERKFVITGVAMVSSTNRSVRVVLTKNYPPKTIYLRIQDLADLLNRKKGSINVYSKRGRAL
jgi:hypothetical protein